MTSHWSAKQKKGPIRPIITVMNRLPIAFPIAQTKPVEEMDVAVYVAIATPMNPAITANVLPLHQRIPATVFPMKDVAKATCCNGARAVEYKI